MRLALWGDICATGQDTKSLVCDVQVLEKLGDAGLPELVAEGGPQARLVGCNRGIHLLCRLLSLHVLLDLAGRLDLGSPAVTLRLLFLGRSLHVLDGLPDDLRLLVLCDRVGGEGVTLAWRQVSVAWLTGDAGAQVCHSVLEGDLAVEGGAHASLVRSALLNHGGLFHFLRCLF